MPGISGYASCTRSSLSATRWKLSWCASRCVMICSVPLKRSAAKKTAEELVKLHVLLCSATNRPRLAARRTSRAGRFSMAQANPGSCNPTDAPLRPLETVRNRRLHPSLSILFLEHRVDCFQRVALQPVIDVNEGLPFAFCRRALGDQLFARRPRFRVFIFHAVIRLKSLDGLLVFAARVSKESARQPDLGL